MKKFNIIKNIFCLCSNVLDEIQCIFNFPPCYLTELRGNIILFECWLIFPLEESHHAGINTENFVDFRILSVIQIYFYIWKCIVLSVYKITLNLCQLCLPSQTNHIWLPYLCLYREKLQLN